MRTLRITLAASPAGWVAGVLTGSVGGFALSLLEFGPGAALRGLTVMGVLVSEVRWGFIAAAAILPCSVFCVAPLVFRELGKPSCSHPFEAACAGAGLGLVALVLWWMVLSFFTTPINWERKGEGLQAAAVCIPTALAIGATTGWVAALMARSHVRFTPAPAASVALDVPPPLPYEY